MTTTATSSESSASEPDANSASDIVHDGFIGGIAAVLLAFLPLSTVLGGGIAGYLQETRPTSAGPRAGALAGGIAFLPHLIVGSYLVLSPSASLPGPEVGVAPEYLLVGIVGFGVIYAIGLGMLGAILGGYVRREHVEA